MRVALLVLLGVPSLSLTAMAASPSPGRVAGATAKVIYEHPTDVTGLSEFYFLLSYRTPHKAEGLRAFAYWCGTAADAGVQFD